MLTNKGVDLKGWAVDVDDVLCDTALKVFEEIYREWPVGGATPPELRRTYDQPGNVPNWQEPTIKNQMSYLLNNPDFISSVPAIPEAKQTLTNLAMQYPHTVQYYITSRLSHLQLTTEHWITDQHFPPALVKTREPGEHAPNWKLQWLSLQQPSVFGLVDNSPDAFFNTEHLPFTNIWLNQTQWWATQLDIPHVVTCRTWEELATQMV